ncbi:MAG TPA: M13 family metallopeptidase, partial [Pseudomonadales bacterium]|nr:M13 family metallopeptidase [Pseudomonadales bacterium]
RLAPEFPWLTALHTFGAPNEDFFVVSQPDAVQALAKLFRATPMDTWRAYLVFHYLRRTSDILPKAIDDAHFNFFGRVITGTLEQKDRWVRAVDDLNGSLLNEAVGQLYVKHHFGPQDKADVEKLVSNLTVAYKKRISQLAWMSDETKSAALKKLDKMQVKIGYPDKWRDYSSLSIVKGDAFGNRKRERIFERDRDLKRLSEPADRSQWLMGPQTVNAYHHSAWNEIVFPAAILQPPFYDLAADEAVNYGSIGAVIGHEMGHGFDDQGAKTNADGVLKNWWSNRDKQRFKALTEHLAKQYSTFEPLPGMHINGHLTLGENIGDLGGLNVSLEAYKLSRKGKPALVLDGFSDIQRYFLGFSQIWRTKIRDDALRRQLIVDPHSPGKYRANGTVRNMDAWYRAFDVKSGDKLYLATNQRIRIW